MQRLSISAVMTLALAAAFAHAEDWPQFMGPNRDGVSSETGLLQKWPAGGPTQLWRIDLGPGFGGAAITDGQVFILDRAGDEADVLRCLDLKKGDELWRYQYEAPGRLSHEGSRSTPTVTDEHVYTVGGFGDVYCISRKTHQPVWSLNLNRKYEEGTLRWGFAQSPLVHGDLVIVSPVGVESPGLVALNKDTGAVVWESEAFGGDYYSSPVIRTVAGRSGILMIAADLVIFVDPADGKTIWKYNGYSVKYAIPSPTVLPDGKHLFITGGYGAGSVMIRVNERGGQYSFEEIFRYESEGSQIHPAIYLNGYLFANMNTNDNLRGPERVNGGFMCIDAKTGRIVWRTGESPSMDRGAFIFADSKIIAMEGETGELFLVDPATSGFKVISKFVALEPKSRRGNKVWAPLALADGFLVVRDQQEMKCFYIGARRLAHAN